jgi:HlyD family secretion protein
MIKYGLPLFAALALTFAVVKIVGTQPVHAKLTPPAAPPSAVYTSQVGAVGLAEAESENIAISLPVPGLVTRVDVKAGDHVRKGARLFSLDDRDLQAELALRQSSLALSESRPPKPRSESPSSCTRTPRCSSTSSKASATSAPFATKICNADGLR